MGIPIKTFWMMNQNIDRILAQRDIRALTVAVTGQGGQEATQSYRQTLTIEVGTVVKMSEDPVRDAVRDEEGFQSLREMATQ